MLIQKKKRLSNQKFSFDIIKQLIIKQYSNISPQVIWLNWNFETSYFKNFNNYSVNNGSSSFFFLVKKLKLIKLIKKELNYIELLTLKKKKTSKYVNCFSGATEYWHRGRCFSGGNIRAMLDGPDHWLFGRGSSARWWKRSRPCMPGSYSVLAIGRL